MLSSMIHHPADTPRSLDTRPGYVLVRTAMKVRQQYVDALSGTGLLPNQHVILSTLNEQGPGHQKEIAERARLDSGDIVAYLDGLEKNGCVERNRDPADRRRQIVSLTAAGARVLAAADIALDEVESATFASLGPAELRAFTVGLNTLYRNL